MNENNYIQSLDWTPQSDLSGTVLKARVGHGVAQHSSAVSLVSVILITLQIT